MSSEIADKYIAAYTLRARTDDRTSAEFKLLDKECKILAKQWFDAVSIETIRAHGLPSAGFVPNASVAEKLGFEIAPRPTGVVKPTIDLPADADLTKIEGVIIERAKTGVAYASLLHLFLQAKFYQVLVKTLPASVQRGDFNRWIKNKSVKSLVLDGVLGVRPAARSAGAAPKPKKAKKTKANAASSAKSSRTASPARSARSEPRTPRTLRSPRTMPSAPTKTPKSPRARNASKVARELFKSPASSAASGGRGRGRGAARSSR